MKHPAIILSFILSICLFLSCNKDDGAYDKQFLKDDTIRMEVSHSDVLRYDPMLCQESYNRIKNSFCVGNDTMSDFFSVKLSELPSESGQMITGSLMWTTSSSIRKEDSVALEVVKLEGDRVWLWSSSAVIGVVVRFLF